MMLSVSSDKKDVLELALRIAMSEHPGVQGFRREPGKITLYWHRDAHQDDSIQRLSGEIAEIVDFLWGWLKVEATYPDNTYKTFDGSSRKGFTLASGHGLSICEIVPYWEYHGK